MHRVPTRRRRPSIVIAGLLALALAEPAAALRCGNKLVTEGMHIAEVLAICGEPALENRRTIVVSEIIPVTVGRRRVFRRDDAGRLVAPGYGPVATEVEVIEYTYNFGPRKFMRLLEFRNAYLSRISDLGYGYHP